YRNQLILFPTNLSRGARLFQLHEDIGRIAFHVAGVMKQADRHVEVGRIATESNTQFMSVGAKSIVVLEKVVKVFGTLSGPKRIEVFDVYRLRLFGPAHLVQQRDFAVEQVRALLRKAIFVLT